MQLPIRSVVAYRPNEPGSRGEWARWELTAVRAELLLCTYPSKEFSVSLLEGYCSRLIGTPGSFKSRQKSLDLAFFANLGSLPYTCSYTLEDLPHEKNTNLTA